jgi:hypothetical protein
MKGPAIAAIIGAGIYSTAAGALEPANLTRAGVPADGSAESFDRAVSYNYTPFNDPGLGRVVDIARLGVDWSSEVKLERFGEGMAKYSFGAVQATWYRYGTNTGFALERGMFSIGGLHIDAGAALVRVATRSVDGLSQSTRSTAFPVMSVDGRGSVRVNFLLAPAVLSNQPSVFFAKVYWTF